MCLEPDKQGGFKGCEKKITFSNGKEKVMAIFWIAYIFSSPLFEDLPWANSTWQPL